MRSGWTGRGSAPRWFAVAVGLFLLVRAVTTLIVGADFGTPSDGWRSVWQLATVALLGLGLARPSLSRVSVAAVGIVYAFATVLELFHHSDLLAVIPVDMRDRLVHPAIALLAFISLWAGRRRLAID